jgi:hypothetical protein
MARSRREIALGKAGGWVGTALNAAVDLFETAADPANTDAEAAVHSVVKTGTGRLPQGRWLLAARWEQQYVRWERLSSVEWLIVGDRIADELISDEAGCYVLAPCALPYHETYETIPA